MRSALRQNLPAPAGTFSCSSARCYTCSFLNSATSISDLNPISLFGTILHAPPPTLFTAFLAVNVANFTSVNRADVYRFAEHLRSVRNNDVCIPVSRHFNDANHSISGINVCAISPLSGGNDSRKRHEKRLIIKIGTIHPHRLNEQFSFI